MARLLLGKRDVPPRPLRSCSTPSWLLALVVLAVNDRYLKAHTAGLGPLALWMVGKASDFAGLYLVLPVAAWFVRARSWRALAGVGFAIATAFILIKTVGPASALYEWFLSPIGARNSVDPSDLVALPMLALCGWRMWRLSAAPEPSRSALWTARLGLVFAAPLCMATSAPPPPPCASDGALGCNEPMSDPESRFVGNPSGTPLVVRVRSAVAERCEPQDPCVTPAWTDDELRVIPPGENAPLPGMEACRVYAFNLGEGFPTVLMWGRVTGGRVPRAAAFPPGHSSPIESETLPLPGGVLLSRSAPLARAVGASSVALCPEVTP